VIKIEIQSTEIRVKSGSSARTGKPYSIREQDGYALTSDKRTGKLKPYPEHCVITLEEDRPPYPPGNYILSAESIWVNRFNQLEISPVLRPLQSAAQVKAA
jgi:hypothetical protein